MRLASVELYGPSGGTLSLQANGEGELVIEVRAEHQIVLIRDTSLPRHEDQDKTARIIAQVPLSWAVCPVWEYTQPAAPTQLRAVEVVRHSGAVIPFEGCFCAECEASRARKRGENA